MEKILEMKNELGKLVKQSRDLLDLAEKEKRSFTADEDTNYKKMEARMDELQESIQREERQLERERSLGQTKDPDPKPADPKKLDTRAAFNKFLLNGMNSLSSEEARAMQADSDTGGGYLITPQTIVMELLKNIDDMTVIKTLSRVIPLTTAKSLGVPTLDTDVDDADWTAELKTGSETDIAFGKRVLYPKPLAKRVKLSNTLMRQAALSPEQLVRERLAYKFGVTEEKAYMTGDGVTKPLGVFTASADGISTGRDISEGNTATKIMPDGLINAKYKLKAGYLTRARWIFHRDAIRDIRKLKDGNGQYIWQPGLAGGAPDRILDIPFLMSEYAPNTFTSAEYVGILGDFSHYWIAVALDMQMIRLSELYAETNQTGFIGRMEIDAMPALEEAFVRVKLG